MANRIQLRRDTAANWTRENPILSQGEPGFDLTANKIKVGDGVTAWADLDGTTTFPNGVYVDQLNGSHFPRIIADTGKAFSVQGQGSTGSVALQWMETASASSQIAQVGLNKFSGIAAVTLTAGSSTPTLKVWRFDETGALTFPVLTIATLPSANPAGQRAFISDGESSLAWGATVSSTGTNTYPVWSDGSIWKYG